MSRHRRALGLALLTCAACAAPAAAVPTVQTHTTITSGVQLTDPVVNVGDVNGDGLEDLGLAQSSGCTGQVWVVFGAAAPATVSLPALGTRGLTLTGLGTALCGNLALAPVGDVNGDGRDDILVRAVRGGQELHRVIYGRPTGGTLDVTALGANGWEITTSDPDLDVDFARGVGDVTGDGRDDLGLSVRDYASRGRSAAWVLPGRAGAAVTDLATGASTALRISNVGHLGSQEVRVLPFGDLTGDGRADILTSARPSTGFNRFDLHAGRPGPGTVDLNALGPTSLALGSLTSSTVINELRPVLGDLDGDGRSEVNVMVDGWDSGKPVAALTSRLTGPVSDAGITAAGLSFFASQTLDDPRLAPAGDLNGDGLDDLAAPASSLHVKQGEFLTSLPVPRTWSFTVSGQTSPRRVDLEAPAGATARLDSMPTGYVAEAGLRFAGGPAQLVASGPARRSVLVQRIVDQPAPPDTTAPAISGVSIDNPTVWRTVPCGTEGGAACPGPRTATLRFTVSEPVRLRARLLNAAGATVLADHVWVDPGTHALAFQAAYRYSESYTGWVNRRMTPGTYRWVLEASDLAGRKAPASTTQVVVAG